MLWLFGATSFVGAALLFLVEPMLAKLVLPAFGGSPTVWNTATLFFQALLLAGYAYVHLASRRLGARRQPWLHLGLLLLPLLALPVGLPSDAAPPPGTEPTLWLLRVMAVAIGLPFAVLATTGPLLQRWLSWTSHPRAGDPYVLYAASNAGSVVGLLGYPFVVEPAVGLGTQTRWWSVAYLGFALLVAACGVAALRGGPGVVEPRPAAEDRSRRPTARTRLGWVALSFLPSSLMLGVTTHVSTDIAAIPLFWTVPLAVYLATFVVAFGPAGVLVGRIAAVVAAVLCVPALAVAVGRWDVAVWQSVALDLAVLGAAGLAAHGRLAATRPPVTHLTGFYLLIAAGGALGGLLNGFVAPVLLDRPVEFPLVLAAVPMLIVLPTRRLGLPASAPSAAVALMLVGAIGVAEVTEPSPQLRERTFFGSYEVRADEDRRRLVHGTTVHGWEELRGRWVGEPTSYYTRSGPAGDVFRAYDGTGLLDEVAVVGLGVGTMAAYAEPGRRIDFFEIDPAVARIARSSFGFLRRAAGPVRVHLGDGRLQLAERDGAEYGLVVLDAFTSDAIPAHLLTAEAVQIYRRALSQDGLIAFHVTNRHVDLVPVLAAQAADLGMVAMVRDDDDADQPAAISTWVVLARSRAALDRLATRPGWEPARAGRARAWTDDYSSLVQVLDVG